MCLSVCLLVTHMVWVRASVTKICKTYLVPKLNRYGISVMGGITDSVYSGYGHNSEDQLDTVTVQIIE